MRRGLEGVRVLEIGELVSAPYMARLLGDLGADVIKIEPAEGDRARRRGPFADDTRDPDASGLHLAMNVNKRGFVLDPDDADAASHGDALLAAADIVVTNLAPADLTAMGIDLDQLHADRPDAVIVSIRPFGLTGPHADLRAEEITVNHGGGWGWLSPGASTEDDRPPLKAFGHQADFHAGLTCATVALSALRKRELTGVGDLIDFATNAHVAGMLEAALIAASYMGENPSRLGSRLLNPWKILPCSDGLIFMVTVEPDQWERLVEFMGEPEWADPDLFGTVDLRADNADLLEMFLAQWSSEHTVEELWHGGQARRICFAPVLTMADMERQAHLIGRGFFVDVDHPSAGTIKHLGAPFLNSRPTWRIERPAPLLDPATRPAFDDSIERSVDNVHTTTRHSKRSPTPSGRPLEGIRVLDFSWVWAGPYAGLHLAFLGAEVIKVESSLRPGLGRRLPLHPSDMEPSLNTSSYFNQWEQGKLSCELDLSSPEAIEIVRGLVAESDVVLENFATGVMEKFGLGFDDLRAINPDIIVASISGYGSVGPLRDYMGYGPTTGPLSGLSSLTGYRDGPPQELGISVGDPSAGMTAAFAICAALVSGRDDGDDKYGRAQYIDVSLWEGTAVNAVEGWMIHAMTGELPRRMGNRDTVMAPHGCFRTAGDDDWITIACATDAEWASLARLIDPDLVGDQRFVSEQARKKNEDVLDEIVAAWCAPRDRWEITDRLQAVGVAAFPSMSPQDLLANDHLEIRGFFERLDHGEVGRRTHFGVPWKAAHSPDNVASPAPLMGQHTDQVLRDVLGLSADEIADLRTRGVAGSR